jgi:hypothetical protein
MILVHPSVVSQVENRNAFVCGISLADGRFRVEILQFEYISTCLITPIFGKL